VVGNTALHSRFTGEQSTTSAASIRLFDKAGDVIWAAPQDRRCPPGAKGITTRVRRCCVHPRRGAFLPGAAIPDDFRMGIVPELSPFASSFCAFYCDIVQYTN
jgi:hypothetical protein